MYDDDCHHRNTYYFASKYVFATAINPKGNRIAMLMTESVGDKYSTSVMICEPGKDEKRSETVFSSGLPMGCCFTENGQIQVVCTDGVYFLDENDGSVKKNHTFDGTDEIKRVSITSDGVAVAMSTQSNVAESRILVFDKKGNMTYNDTVTGGMTDMEYYDGYVIINQNTSIIKINVKDGKRTSVKTAEGGNDIIVYDSGNILLCYRTKAMYVNI